jgi:hypothetical protein
VKDTAADLEDGGLVGEAEGQVLELERAARDADGELLVQELGGEQEVALRGARSELHHVPQAHPRLLQARPPPDLLRHRPRHRLRRHRRRSQVITGYNRPVNQGGIRDARPGVGGRGRGGSFIAGREVSGGGIYGGSRSQ